jgi:predicted nuclease of predicted toxin-antitoxin system
MKLLLDECVPRKFKASLAASGQECVTVPEAGFAGRRNGELLALAEENFQVFITLDEGFRYQQNLSGRKIAVLLIRAKSNRLTDLLPWAEHCRKAISTIQPGQIVLVGGPD